MGKRLIFDFLALGLIIIFAYFSLAYWDYYYPLYFDVYDLANHLATSVGFQRAGGFVLHNFWEFPPNGEPHYYPPLLHLIGAFFLKLGFSGDLITKWGVWGLYSLSFLTAWLAMRFLWGAKPAFYGLFLLSLPFLWVEKLWGLPANGLLLVLIPLVLWALAKKKYLTVFILTILGLASHLLGLVLPLTILIYGLQRKEQRRKILFYLAILGIFTLPFLWLALKRISFTGQSSATWLLNFRQVKEISNMLNFKYQPFGYLGILAVLGLVICYFKKKEYLLLPSLFFSYLPLFLINRGYRFWVSNAVLVLAMLGGVFLYELERFLFARIATNKKSNYHELKPDFWRGLFYSLLVIFLLFIGFPLTNKLAHKEHWPTLIVFRSAYLWEPYRLEISHQSKKEMAEVAKLISGEREFVYLESSFNSARGVSAFSQRSVSTREMEAKLWITRSLPVPGRLLHRLGNFYLSAVLHNEKAVPVFIPRPFLSFRSLKIIFWAMVFLLGTEIIFLPIALRIGKLFRRGG